MQEITSLFVTQSLVCLCGTLAVPALDIAEPLLLDGVEI